MSESQSYSRSPHNGFFVGTVIASQVSQKDNSGHINLADLSDVVGVMAVADVVGV